MLLAEKLRAYAAIIPKARRNRTDLFRHVVRRPGIAAGVGVYELGLALSGRLDNRTKALAGLKAASLVGCEFCLDLGSAAGRGFGITDADLMGLVTYRRNDAFTDREKLAIELSEAMTATPADVSEALLARLRQEFSPAQLVELAAEIAWENHRARINRALGVRAMGFSDGALCLRPEATAQAR